MGHGAVSLVSTSSFLDFMSVPPSLIRLSIEQYSKQQLTVSSHLPLKVDVTIFSAELRLHGLQKPPAKSIRNIRISKIDVEIGLVDVVAQVCKMGSRSTRRCG
jgi:hypothetical protein